MVSLRGESKQAFDYNSLWAYSKNLSYEKAENVQDFFQRVYQFLDDAKEKYADKNVLIVSHAGIMKVVECYANGMMDDCDIGPYLPDNASVLKYSFMDEEE